MTRFGVPGQNIDTLSYADDRLATVPSIQAPRRPTVNDKKFPLWCEWRVNKEASLPAEEGEFWKLVRYESNGDATWVMFGGGGSGPLINIETDDGTPNVVPDGFGEVQILGGAGISVTGQGPGNIITVSLTGGGAAIDQINVDFNTGPGTDPVLPSGTGEIQIYGNTVTNATNANAPVATHSRAVNQLQIDVQLAIALAASPADPFDVGLCSFDEAMFTVDGNGFVQLSGGGLAIDEIAVDANTGPGTDPVIPNGSGQITVAGAAVVAHSVPIETHSRAANAYNIEVQVASDITGAPGNTNDAGLASFDDTAFLVDADGYVQSLGGVQPTFSNIGIGYASGTGIFTVHGYDGTALSASNPGVIWMQSDATPGLLKKYEVTADQTFIDDNGASEIINNLFGLTTGVAYASDIPFFLYAVVNGDPGTNLEPAIAFMLSRVPQAQVAPAVGIIGAPDDAVADTQGSFFSFDNITEADYTGQPCLCVGSFRMQMSASDDWTVQTLDSLDGIGNYQESRTFTLLPATFGAGTSSFIQDNGGTAPTFSSLGYTYSVQKDGYCFASFVISGDAGTDGAGAVSTQVIMPYASAAGGNFGIVRLEIAGAGTYCGCEINAGTNIFIPRDIQDTVTLNSVIQNADFVNGTRQLSGYVYIKINNG